MTFNFHSPLARALFDKIQHQNQHSNTSHQEWYTIREKYLPRALLDKFKAMDQDEETRQFIETCFVKSDWLLTQIYHGLVKSFLTWFISATSANGLLNRGSMFVFSEAQLAQLLQGQKEDEKEDLRYQEDKDQESNHGDPPKLFDRVLDLGAGDGNITVKFRPFFRELYATEISTTMKWRLEQKKIKLLDVESWTTFPHLFDVISCLNLLDRCDRPLTLLQDIKRMLRPDTGLLLLAVVFPIKQYVENNADHRATELIDSALTKIWEVQFAHFVRHVIEPSGFRLVRWTRLPYLCEGDFSRSFYSLNDVVMVLRPCQQLSDTVVCGVPDFAPSSPSAQQSIDSNDDEPEISRQSVDEQSQGQ